MGPAVDTAGNEKVLSGSLDSRPASMGPAVDTAGNLWLEIREPQ